MTDTSMGHNQGPAFNPEVVETYKVKAREFADAAGDWKEAGPIETEEQATRANDFLNGVKQLWNDIEARRVEEKAPFLQAGKQIDAAFNSVKELASRSETTVKQLLEAYMQAKEAAAREEQRKAEEAARKEREEAERKAREAESRNDLVGQQEAEKAKEAAEEKAAEAEKPVKARVESATGGGRTAALRTTRYAKITSINSALLYYRRKPELTDLILRLANAEIRAAKGAEITIPGIEIITERKL